MMPSAQKCILSMMELNIKRDRWPVSVLCVKKLGLSEEGLASVQSMAGALLLL